MLKPMYFRLAIVLAAASCLLFVAAAAWSRYESIRRLQAISMTGYEEASARRVADEYMRGRRSVILFATLAIASPIAILLLFYATQWAVTGSVRPWRPRAGAE